MNDYITTRFFLDTSTGDVLDWADTVVRFIEQLQYDLTSDEASNYLTYSMQNYLDDAAAHSYYHLVEFEDVLDDRYMADIQQIGLDNIMCATPNRRQGPGLTRSILGLINSQNLDILLDAASSGYYEDNFGTTWQCLQTDGNLLLFTT